MRTFFLALIILLGCVDYSFAQITLDYNAQETINFFKTNDFISGSGNVLTANKIKGSPYLNDDFFYGSIYTIQKEHYSDIPLRFNIYNDDLEFKTPEGKIQALATPEIVEKAIFGSTQLVYYPYVLKKKVKKGFFIVLEEGKVSLYAKPAVEFQEATTPGAFKDPEPPKFVKKSDEYYLRIGNNPAKIISSKKELMAAFPDNQDQVINYMSKNKIKTHKPETLKKLVGYYNSL